MRAQSSIEYLAVIAFLLTALVMVVVYAVTTVTTTTQVGQAESSAQSLAGAIQTLGSQGYPAKKSIVIVLPDNIEAGSSLSNYTATIRIRRSTGVQDIVAYHDYCATGILPSRSGAYTINLFVDKDYCVKISQS